MICAVSTKDYEKLITVWEHAVRATHHFLQEDDLQAIKQMLLTVYFDAVQLQCYKNHHGTILGFSGISGKKLEMLFVLPQARGQGIGTLLCKQALEHHKVSLVDVNEQNPLALRFYEKMGFKIIGRSSLDGEGKPYPILHLSLG